MTPSLNLVVFMVSINIALKFTVQPAYCYRSVVMDMCVYTAWICKYVADFMKSGSEFQICNTIMRYQESFAGYKNEGV